MFKEWKEKRNQIEQILISKYPLWVYAIQIFLLLILAWTAWQMSKEDYKSRAICSMFYEVQPQVNECKQPAFICLDVDKQNPFYNNFSTIKAPTPGATPGPT